MASDNKIIYEALLPGFINRNSYPKIQNSILEIFPLSHFIFICYLTLIILSFAQILMIDTIIILIFLALSSQD